MADSVREQIGQQLLAKMQTVTQANGYETNLGEHFARAQKSMDLDDIKTHGASGTFFLGSEERNNKYGVGGRSMQVKFELYDYVRQNETQDVTINRLDADITKRLEIPFAGLAALIESISITSIEPEYAEENGVTLSLDVIAEVVYMVERGDPTKPA